METNIIIGKLFLLYLNVGSWWRSMWYMYRNNRRPWLWALKRVGHGYLT